MRTLPFLLLFCFTVLAWAEVPVIRVDKTINPGTADYIIANITKAEQAKAPYIIIELDTPGGLLSATRKIVQKMLNSTIPNVVFVSPSGASATSAGALITFAADVAAMAPGTHIGAAHPVIPGNKEVSETMDKKITSDTAAFAESLAKAKGRNTQWAISSVKDSASLIAKNALDKDVIDIMAKDLSELVTKLKGFKLRLPKNKITALSDELQTTRFVEMSLKQKLVAFFAHPELAYMIMSLGALCIWIELSNPGLIFPGILGVFCIILSLVAFQLLPISYGALALIVLGLALMVAEIFLSTYGLVAIAGIVSFIFGSMFLMDTPSPEFQISLNVILPTVGVLAGAIFLLAWAILRSRKAKVRSGTEDFMGEYAEVRDEVTHASGGKVFIHGELWNAVVDGEQPIPPGSIVTVKGVRGMLLVVEPQDRKLRD